MVSLTFGLFNQVSGLGPLGPLVLHWKHLILWHVLCTNLLKFADVFMQK